MKKGIYSSDMKDNNRFIIQKIKQDIIRVLSEKGLELFDMTLRSERGGKVLRITIDKETGPGIEDCTEASRAISAFLDGEDNIVPLDKYHLEVSTPGLERPLRSQQDFVRQTGKKCKIITVNKDESGRKSYTGKIDSVDDSKVTLYVEKESAAFEISLDNISKANLVVEF
ncbi:protein of unknown function DUF150 [Denitrovibrio acetiphilus DSM 12809]|uniref:Ribosome maturation factor RimP n=1 Tax=Denitrovibrio acetiphilus (strain DSM 12809 / NBRC 114555 / N2460) TaxID=522772 RepID=D4H7W6_DENA2|nr:ribosome maturation factor RimP [Denitrovibrio acetiphilus]ADD68115.1 protein of unknown function DUF150 [Denitrovibrio acetiphilus DSM 12809]